MATHSSILAWKIPWMEKPGRLQSMGLQSRTRLSDFTLMAYFKNSNLNIFSVYPKTMSKEINELQI